jgi:hypothetical protein
MRQAVGSISPFTHFTLGFYGFESGGSSSRYFVRLESRASADVDAVVLSSEGGVGQLLVSLADHEESGGIVVASLVGMILLSKSVEGLLDLGGVSVLHETKFGVVTVVRHGAVGCCWLLG